MSHCSHMYCCTGPVCMREESERMQKALDELRSRLDFKASELYQRNQTLTLLHRDVETARLDAANWKKLADNMREANTALVESEARLLREISSVRAAKNAVYTEVAALKKELARHRPTEPKFRVGQVIWNVVSKRPIKVESIINGMAEGYPPVWLYNFANGLAVREDNTRALTDEEK